VPAEQRREDSSVPQADLLGAAEVDLQTVACGPCSFKLALLDAETSEYRGIVKFTCVMKMLSPDFTVFLDELRLTRQGSPNPGMLSISSSLAEHSVTEVPYSEEGVWGVAYGITLETTLHDILRDPEREYIKIVVFDQHKVWQGEASIPFRDWFTLGEKSVPFKVDVICSGTADSVGGHMTEGRENVAVGASGAVGDISGILLFQKTPVYAQMVGGLCMDNCIEGGLLLFEGLPYPSRIRGESPPIWQGVGIASDGASVGGSSNLDKLEDKESDINVDITEAECQDVLREIEVPQNWVRKQDRKTGRTYFADLRTRKTTWKDPRFLPENWDQRIDQNSGQVYYAYHKTRQTTFIDPRGCHDGWEMRLSRSGNAYYAYLTTKQTTYIDPRGLPEGYDAMLDDHGRMYFQNHRTRSTQWDDPRSNQPAETLASWRAQAKKRWWKDQVWRELELKWQNECAAEA
jgi:hypothetical protein